MKPLSTQCRKSMIDWVEIFGTPDKVQLDQDGSFRGDFRDILDRFGVEVVLVARDDARWSHGMVERKVLTIKEMMARVARDSEIGGSLLTCVAVVNCVNATNRMSNHKGFSPAQCVLGFEPNLPEVLGHGRGLPAVDPQANFAMAQRMKLLQDCEKAFVQPNHSASLRRKVLAQTRQQPGPFELRSLVTYNRSGLKRKAYKVWRGPARVVGKDVQGYWLVHRGTPILAHPNNLRRAIAEEHDLTMEDDAAPEKTGQQGFLDLSRRQEPIDIEEESPKMLDNEYEPTEGPDERERVEQRNF